MTRILRTRIFPLTLFIVSIVWAADQLTPAVTSELASQCLTAATYQSCVSALRNHGSGKDGAAMDSLISEAPTEAAKLHYKIAQSWPNDAFWKIVATAGGAATDCSATLDGVLKDHFSLSPTALSSAADDSAKNNFLALSDLLAVPTGKATADWLTSSKVYRRCFGQDPGIVFTAVKKTLGQ
jgi:hypothetical protein